MKDDAQLAQFLRSGRERKGLTLRAVDDQTGVSNAYLSQLESGKIRQPSPTVLHRLCELYGTSYANAMLLAGYPVPGTDTPDTDTLRRLARFGDVTEDEEAELHEYLSFLRRRRRGGKRP